MTTEAPKRPPGTPESGGASVLVSPLPLPASLAQVYNDHGNLGAQVSCCLWGRSDGWLMGQRKGQDVTSPPPASPARWRRQCPNHEGAVSTHAAGGTAGNTSESLGE